MKITHIVIAIALIIVGISIAIAGWNGITNTINHPPVVQQEAKKSYTDILIEQHDHVKIAEPVKPMNPFVIPVMEFMGGIGFVAGGAYLIATKRKTKE